MATKSITFDSIMRDIKARRFSPIYILMGEESYYIDKIADELAATVLSPEEQDFNQTVLFGADTNATTVVDMARRYPMMAEYQVVIVKEAQNIKNTEALEKYFKQPMPSTILVMCHKNGSIDRRKREYVKSIQGCGVLFESKKLKDKELPAFIEKYLKNRSNHFEIHLELKDVAYLRNFVTTIRQLGLAIDDIEFNSAYLHSGLSVYSVSISIGSKELKKYKTHSEIIDALRSLDYIYHIEEMK